MIYELIKKIKLFRLERKGFKHGKNFDMEKGSNIDRPFCKTITCGDNVTLARNVYVLAHDASMKKKLGKTKVSSVKIGDNVFIGAGSIILPGVIIGDNVIIGAGSIVTHSIPDGEVWCGNPAHFIKKTADYLKEKKIEMNNKKDSYVD